METIDVQDEIEITVQESLDARRERDIEADDPNLPAREGVPLDVVFGLVTPEDLPDGWQD